MFEVQRFARAGRTRRGRASAAGRLQLGAGQIIAAWVSRNIADSENPRCRRGRGCLSGGDLVTIEFRPQSAIGPRVMASHGETDSRNHGDYQIATNPENRAGIRNSPYRRRNGLRDCMKKHLIKQIIMNLAVHLIDGPFEFLSFQLDDLRELYDSVQH